MPRWRVAQQGKPFFCSAVAPAPAIARLCMATAYPPPEFTRRPAPVFDPAIARRADGALCPAWRLSTPFPAHLLFPVPSTPFSVSHHPSPSPAVSFLAGSAPFPFYSTNQNMSTTYNANQNVPITFGTAPHGAAGLGRGCLCDIRCARHNNGSHDVSLCCVSWWNVVEVGAGGNCSKTCFKSFANPRFLSEMPPA
jgi:hypothetical protein